MPIPVPMTVAQLQSDFINAYCASLDPGFGANPANIPSGDPVEALGFASAAVGVQLQQGWLALYAFAFERRLHMGATWNLWFADFGFTRFQGSPADAVVNIPTSNGQNAVANINIPSGTVIQTQPIVVSPSTTPALYSFKTVGAATLLAGHSSVQVSVVATVNGSQYNNILASSPLQFGTTISGLGEPDVRIRASVRAASELRCASSS